MTKLAIVLILFLLFSSSSFCAPLTKEVCFETVCLQAEISDTESKRQLGLMFRQTMPEHQGMLFVFEKEEVQSFWMKNMKFPLDIIWIDKDKRIVDIKINVLPCNGSCAGLMPQAKAQYVLEVNAGFTEKNRVKVGDRVDF